MLEKKKSLTALDWGTKKWTPQYPNLMERYKDNWDTIFLIFKFSGDVWKALYTYDQYHRIIEYYLFELKPVEKCISKEILLY